MTTKTVALAIVLFGVFAVACGTNPAAPTPAPIAVELSIVNDRTGAPVSGAEITWSGALQGATDTRGVFTLHADAGDMGTLVVYQGEYAPYSAVRSFGAADVAATIRLSPLR